MSEISTEEQIAEYICSQMGTRGPRVRKVFGNFTNHIFEISLSDRKQYILKMFRPLFWGYVQERFDSEESALRRNKDNLLVPKLTFAEPHGFCGLPTILTERVPGKSITELLAEGTLDSTAIATLVVNATVCVSQVTRFSEKSQWYRSKHSPAHFAGEFASLKLLAQIPDLHELCERIKASIPRLLWAPGHDVHLAFCHGDLTLTNILVDRNLEVTGIVDWEASRFTFLERDLGTYLFSCLVHKAICSREGLEMILRTLWIRNASLLAFFVGCNLLDYVGFSSYCSVLSTYEMNKLLQISFRLMSRNWKNDLLEAELLSLMGELASIQWSQRLTLS